MGQRGRFNTCGDCALWRGFLLPDETVQKFGVCLRDNIGDWSHLATPLHVTASGDICETFIARTEDEKNAGSPRGSDEPALVINAGAA